MRERRAQSWQALGTKWRGFSASPCAARETFLFAGPTVIESGVRPRRITPICILKWAGFLTPIRRIAAYVLESNHDRYGTCGNRMHSCMGFGQNPPLTDNDSGGVDPC